MLPLFLLIPLIIGGTIAVAKLIDLLSEDTKEALRECRKLVILGDRGSGKTTLWNGLRGLRASGGYTQTMGLESVDSFSINANGRQVTIEKGADIGGSDELVAPYYQKLLAGEKTDSDAAFISTGLLSVLCDGGIVNVRETVVSKTVVFYLVSAVDLMRNERECSRINVPRLRICQSAIGKNGAIILLLTQMNKFVKEYGDSQKNELLKRSQRYFGPSNQCGGDGHIPVELTNSDDIEKIKKLIVG